MAANESPRTKRHITVRIDEGVMAGVDEVMRETGGSMSATIESLLAAGLESRSGAGELDAVLDRRIDELFEKIDARIADMSAAADARVEKSASAAAKSLDRAARDINTVRKNAGTAAQASLAGFMMQTWFMPSMLKSTAADLHDRLLWPGKAGAIFDVSKREDGSVILDDKLLPSDFYKWWWGVAGYGRRLAGDPSIVSKASAAASDFLDRFSEEEVASMIEASIDPEKSVEVIEGYRKDIKERLESTGEAS